MSRRVVGVVVLIGLIAAGLWWWQHGDHAVEDGKTEAGHAHVSRARDPHDPANRAAWLGQAGIADRKIAGIVVEDSGPLAGAIVHLIGKPACAGLGREATATTNATGQFDFGERPAMYYSLVAEAPGLIGTGKSVDLRDPTLASDPVTLVLHACTASVHGTVRDGGDGVVAKAHVARELAFGLTAGVDTDDKGAFDLCVPMSGTVLTVHADGYAFVADFVAAFGRVTHDFVLGPEATISGHAVRAGDHTPVADAVIELRGVTGTRSTFASTDAEGHFNFAAIAPGRQSLLAYGDHLSSTRPVDVIAEVGVPLDTTIELAPTVAVSGKIVGHDHTTPIVGVAIRLNAMTGNVRVFPDAVSQQDGSFVIAQVLPGDYKANVYGHPNPDAHTLTVGASDVKDVIVEVDKLGSISGRITHGGKPVDGASVYTTGHNAVSDANGTYTLRNLAAGSFTIGAESKRLGAFSHGPTIELGADEDRTGVDIETELAGSVSGIVVDQTSAPVAGVSVKFVLGKNKDFGTATTADDGTFEARAMSGGGDYACQIRPTENSPISYSAVDGKPLPIVTVATGDTHIRDLRIAIQFDRLTISGHVLDAQGQPVSDATVHATPASARGNGGPFATTDASGAFAIHDLTDGTYNVFARAARGEGREQAVMAGRTNVELHLESLGSIDGTLVGFTDVPELFVSRDGDRIPSSATVAGTSFHAVDLQPGMYRVVVRAKAGFGFEMAPVAGDAPTKLTVRLRGAGSLDGTAGHPNLRCSYQHVPRDLDVVASAASFNATETATSDANGAFHFDRVVEGPLRVTCTDGTTAVRGVAAIAVGETAHVELN